MSRRMPGSRALLLACVALAGCGAQPGTETASPAQTAPGSAAVPAAATLASPKVSPSLASLARRVRAAADGSAAAALSGAGARVNTAREIEVYVRVSNVVPAVAAALRRAGARIEGSAATLGTYQAWVTPAALGRLADLPEVERISLPAYGQPRNTPPPD